MADYFHEMSRTELGPGEVPDTLALARNFMRIWDYLTEGRFNLAPPASKNAVAALPKIHVTEKDKECPVCLKVFLDNDIAIMMPCKHSYHEECIMHWLEKTNSCPLCRYELPTDDEDYEIIKKQKERIKEQEKELEQLHNSMYT